MDFVLIFSLALLVQLGTAQTGCTTGDVQLLEEEDPMNRIIGFVQYCVDSEWKTICTGDNDWSTQEANVACGQIGYSDQGAQVGKRCNEPVTTNVPIINCNGGEKSLQDCRVQVLNCSCDPATHVTGQARAVCQPADCADGEIRLVNGTTNREGRVEVCLDGRWETVCSQTVTSGDICQQLGYPRELAITNHFGQGTGPVYSCSLNDCHNTLNCNHTTNVNCEHSMDLGVVCQTYQQVIDQIINETRQECTQPSPVTTLPVSCDECVITDGAANQSCDGTTALGAVNGVLVALLVAMAIGWICTCVFLRRKPSQKREASVADLMEQD